MTVRPRDVMRSLPDDPRLWDLAAGAMADGGHSLSVIAGHLVAHAPTPDAFAAGITAVTDPTETLTVAALSHAHPDQLAATSEALGLSPADTASVLTGHAADPVVLDTLALRCDGDHDTATELAAQAGIGTAAIDAWRNPTPLASVTPIRDGIDADTSALLDSLPPPGPSREIDPLLQLDTLLDGLEPTTLEPAP